MPNAVFIINTAVYSAFLKWLYLRGKINSWQGQRCPYAMYYLLYSPPGRAMHACGPAGLMMDWFPYLFLPSDGNVRYNTLSLYHLYHQLRGKNKGERDSAHTSIYPQTMVHHSQKKIICGHWSCTHTHTQDAGNYQTSKMLQLRPDG